MYARVIKDGKEVWSSEYVVSVYEDKMKGNTTEKFITFDCRICECPPHYETRSFLDRDYDEVILKRYYSYEDYERDKEATIKEQEESSKQTKLNRPYEKSELLKEEEHASGWREYIKE